MPKLEKNTKKKQIHILEITKNVKALTSLEDISTKVLKNKTIVNQKQTAESVIIREKAFNLSKESIREFFEKNEKKDKNSKIKLVDKNLEQSKL